MAELDRIAVASGLEIRQMMELAGWHMIQVFHRLEINTARKVTIVVGKGNKGGDGLSAARHLFGNGWNDIQVVLTDRETSEDSQHHLNLLRRMNLPIACIHDDVGACARMIQEADVLIDALVGYRMKGDPRGSILVAMEMMLANEFAPIIAYDLPTGVNPDTGQRYAPYLPCAATLTLALPKNLFQTEDGLEASGRVFLADIGIPAHLYDQIAPGSRPDFGTFGVVEIPSNENQPE